MRHSVKSYARAFAEVAAGVLKKADEDRIVKNFATLVQKNGDGAKWNAILTESAKFLREKEGRRRVMIETARPLDAKIRKQLHGSIRPEDIVEESINPSLVAGVRITVNDEEQFDASLARRLQKLFG
jgi:F0F1-type ATP synthase delta subunit